MSLKEPLLVVESTRRSASFGYSCAVLAKTVVGTGMFALPPAIRATGWVFGTLMVLTSSIASTYALVAIIATIHELRRRGGVGGLDGRIEFEQMTRAAFSSGSRLGRLVNGVIVVVAIVGQLGSIIGFVAFVSANMLDITPEGIFHWHIVLLYCAFLAPMSLLRDTTHPVFEGAMHFGNLAVAVAVATVLYSGFAESGVHELPRAADPTGLGLGFGVNIFMFTAYMEVVSIEQDMADRSRFMPMIVTTLIAITALYLAFGLLVYSFYGEATGRLWLGDGWVDATILQNIESTSGLVQAVKVAYSLNLLLMRPIVLLPASKAMEDALGVVASPAARIALVGVIGVGAVVLPSFEVVTAIMGGLTALLAFTVPALCYLSVCGGSLGPMERAWLVVVGLLGVGGCVYTLADLVPK